MIFVIFVAIAALIVFVVTIISLVEFFKGRRLVTQLPAHGDVIVPIPDGIGANPNQVILLGATTTKAQIQVRWIYSPGDEQTPKTVKEVQKRVPTANIRAIETPVPGRHVAQVGRMIEALKEPTEETVAFVAPECQPASKEIIELMAAGNSHRCVVAGIPGPSPGMKRFESSVAMAQCHQAPILFAVNRAEGIWPLITVAPRDLWHRASTNTLSTNRSNPTAILTGDDRNLPVLVLPTVAAMAPGTVKGVQRRHFQHLTRTQPLKTLVFACCLFALPASLLVSVFANSGTIQNIGVFALALSATSRGAIAATWGTKALGTLRAVQGWFLAPLWDLQTLVSMIPAAILSSVKLGEGRYKITSGGVLIPVRNNDT